MENASKALIIAGAILLSIVLITLGVLIIGRGQEAIDKANIDEQVVSTWNQKFSKYTGNSVRGTSVNTLINEVLSSNGINTTNDPEKLILLGTTNSTLKGEVKGTANGREYTKAIDSVDSSKKYSVQIIEYSPSGFVYKIRINQL